MKRYEDPAWTERMAVGLDFNFAMADFVGEHGLRPAELEALAPRMAAVRQDLEAGRQDGRYAFLELPYRVEMVHNIRRLTKPLMEWCWEFVVLGIGGSALGARALFQALCHPQHNKMPLGRRHHCPGLWVVDNIDPYWMYGLLDGIELKRTAVNVISKSGTTAETLAQFLFIFQVLKNRVGEAQAGERFIITNGPGEGPFKAVGGAGGISHPERAHPGGR